MGVASDIPRRHRLTANSLSQSELYSGTLSQKQNDNKYPKDLNSKEDQGELKLRLENKMDES